MDTKSFYIRSKLGNKALFLHLAVFHDHGGIAGKRLIHFDFSHIVGGGGNQSGEKGNAITIFHHLQERIGLVVP